MPMDADIDYFRAVKESELANAPAISRPRRKASHRAGRSHTSKRANYAVRVLAAASPFNAGIEATARRMDQLKDEQAPWPLSPPWRLLDE